jgi:hypothetical protein
VTPQPVSPTPAPRTPADVQATLEQFLATGDIAYERPSDELFVLTLPGEHKLRTTLALTVGAQSLTVNAFVARNPDENREAVYRWLLEKNRRMYAVAFAIDHLGDIYLAGHLPLHSVDHDELDRVIGSVLEYADGSFNTILELGFAGAIRKEWAWRRSRGESTANLEAFAHLAEPQSPEE